MTTPTPLAAQPATTAVTVALVGPVVHSARTIHAALAALPGARETGWRVEPAGDASSPQIAVCAGTAAVATAVATWPDVFAVALVPERDPGDGVLAALEAGATTCMRGGDADLIAAYVRAVARRQGLVPGDGLR